MAVLRHTALAFQQGTSDKVYEVDLREADGGFEVVTRYGRRGKALRENVMTASPVSREDADALFDKTVASKTKKGYEEVHVSSPAPKRPVDSEARTVAILARLHTAVDTPDTETDWPVDRVIWRAGELRIAEAAPLILQLATADVSAEQAVLRLYSSLWALGRIGRATPNRSEAYDLALAYQDADAQPAHIHRIAREAALQLATDAERDRQLEALRTEAPETVQNALINDEACRQLVDTLLSANTPADLASIETLTQLALTDETARELVTELARSMPLAAPFFVSVRYLIKVALFREDAELFGILAHRFATEASGLNAFETGYDWGYDGEGETYKTVSRHLHQNPDTGHTEYRRTTSSYKSGDWRNRTSSSETQVRTPDGLDWVDTDALTRDQSTASASLGYTPKTRAYLRRRMWRTLRRLGEAGDAAYVPMAVGALLAYTDDDAQEPRTIVYNWYHWETRSMRSRTTRYDAFAPYLAFNHILYANSPRFVLKKSNKAWSLREGVEMGTPAPEAREEAFPALWDARPEGLMHLVSESRCAPVHTFAVRALRANPDFLDRLDVDDVLMLLSRSYPETVGLGLELAERLYDPATPDRQLVDALLGAALEDARKMALSWIADQPKVFLHDSTFAAALLTHEHADVRAGARELLTSTTLLGLNTEALIGRCLATLIGFDAETDADRIRGIGDALLALFPEPLSRISLGAIEDLIRHPVPAVQAVGGRLLVHHQTPPEALPGALIAALMTASDAETRAEGMTLFAGLPDASLLDQPETLEALALSPLSDVRAAARPVIARLAGASADFASSITESLLPPLYRRETIDGLHADLSALLSDDAFATARGTFDRDRLWGLLHANPTPTQDLGALVLTERDWDETLTLRQITRLASHELATVREAAWTMVDRQPDRMRETPIDALTLLDASWDDSRTFAFAFFQRTFDADVWTPDLLVHVVDSTRPDVQAFGQELIGQFFDDGDGPTYLLKLSEHPSVTVQEFASSYLETYAGSHLDRIESLVAYFRAVLGQVNRGRVAKNRVLAFLEREATTSPEAGAIIAPLLAHHSATIAVGDKATLIEAMRDLQDAQPDLDLPLERVPVLSLHEVSDAV
ncbi:MAG: WGR domain-containing protein [Bacteroidota bacterium]